ncbi:Cu(+)/Ag(+) sensor histidine kinase [Alcaligenes phenolicus]|uniref:Cu(+)/Ag(+) sensor histidine kinase n=1 Tax=Alcaligenes phenolicus TaxID=232846 RepID=UPI0003FD8E55
MITVVLLAFGWMIERSINNHFIQQDVDELNAVLQTLKHTIATLPEDYDPEALQATFANAISGHHNAQYRISTPAGSAIYSTPGANLERFAKLSRPVDKIDIDTVGTWEGHNETYRGAVVKMTPDSRSGTENITITIATGINFHLRYLESFRNYLRLITVAASLIAIVFTWLAVHQGHAPIRRISREIGRIKSDQLHIRLAPDTVPAELVELAKSFNQMLDRLEDVFRRLSDFSGDIAHELRTPITNIKTQTEVALSQARSVEQYREILYSNLEEYDRMAKMVGDMLFLAQADNKLLKPELVAIDLEAEIRILFDYFGAWAEEREVALDLSGEPVNMLGDRLMIRRVLSNLLSNAIRHTPSGETVSALIKQTGTPPADIVKIRIKNPGPAIPGEHLPRIFERFYRPDSSRQRSGEGAGLGLAIAKSITEAHGGSITVTSNEEATTFEISFPISIAVVVPPRCSGP